MGRRRVFAEDGKEQVVSVDGKRERGSVKC